MSLEQHRHRLVQATVPPLDEDGGLALAVGTAAFAIASCFVHGWWLQMTLTGVGVGLAALAYVLWRRHDRRRTRSS